MNLDSANYLTQRSINLATKLDYLESFIEENVSSSSKLKFTTSNFQISFGKLASYTILYSSYI